MSEHQEEPIRVEPFDVDREQLKAVLHRSEQARKKSQELIAEGRAARERRTLAQEAEGSKPRRTAADTSMMVPGASR